MLMRMSKAHLFKRWKQASEKEFWETWLESAQTGISPSWLQRASFSLHIRVSRLCQWSCVLLSEICNAYQRMKIRQSESSCPLVGRGFQMCPKGHLEEDIRTHARTHDIRSMLSNRPWATVVDLQTYLEGWDKGAEWAVLYTRNPDSCNAQLGTDTQNHPRAGDIIRSQ